MQRSIGDEAQVRLIIEQTAEAVISMMGDRVFGEEKIKQIVEDEVKKNTNDLMANINKRFLFIVLGNVIPMLLGAFFLGGLWMQFADIPSMLEGRGLWMQRQEYHDRRQDDVLQRLDPTYSPPEYREIPD